MATHLYFRLTDGTNTITFADGTGTPGNYTVDIGWAPSAPGRANDLLSPLQYNPVEDPPLTVNVTGATITAMFDNLEALTRLLDQAEAWANGDQTVSPVRIQFIPAGSPKATSAPYEATIIGAPSSGRMWELPQSYMQSGNMLFVIGVQIRWRRIGLWLNETDVAASSATGSGGVWTCTFGTAHTQPSPVSLSWTMPTTGTSTVSRWYVGQQAMITAASSSDVSVTNFVTGFSGTNGTNIGDPNALGGQFYLSNIGASTMNVFTSTIPAILATPGQYAFYIMGVPFDSAVLGTWSAQVYLGVYSGTGATDIIQSAWQTPTTNAWSPNGANVLTQYPAAVPIFSGIVNIPAGNVVRSLNMNFRRITGTTSRIGINYLVIQRIGRLSNAVTFAEVRTDADTWGTSQAMAQTIDHRLTTALSPISTIERTDGARRYAHSVSGNQIIFTSGTTISGVWMCGIGAPNTPGTGDISAWPFRLASNNTTLHTSVVTATRRRAYLVPE